MPRVLKYSVSTWVDVHVAGGSITYPEYSTGTASILIIGACSDTIYIPYLGWTDEKCLLKNFFTPSESDCRNYSIPPHWRGKKTLMIEKEICIIGESKSITKPLAPDGTNCAICKEFYPMAEPNRFDGKLVCFRCKPYSYMLEDLHVSS